MTAVADFFGTIVGKFALGGGIVAFLIGIWQVHDHRVRVDERKTTIARIDEGAKALNAKGLKARASVRDDGAFERLRREYCNGC